MTALIDKDVPLPLYLMVKKDMTDEEFILFCTANRHLRIERDEDNQIIVMAPTGGETGSHHSELIFFIQLWNKQHHSGRVFDSSTGFKLPDRSMRSPDAAWITAEKWNSLSEDEREKFLPFAPDFFVEVLSPTDELLPAQQKMQKWIENGARLGWLIVPKQQTAFIYRSDGTVDRVQGFHQKLSGEDVLPGFDFDLSVLL